MHRRFASAFAITILLSAAVAIAGPAEVAPRLTRAMAETDSPLAVWVYFADRNLTGAALDRALDRAGAELDPRAARRRAKVLRPGDRLVDARDLPVAPRYLARVGATGAALRRASRWLNAASFDATPGQIRRIAALDCVDRVDLVARFRRPEVPVDPVPIAPRDATDSDKTGGGPDQVGGPDKVAAWTVGYGANLAAMEQVNVPPVHELGIHGQGVIIGVLDTGFHTAHEALSGVPVIAAYDFVNDDANVDTEGADPANAHSHGTMVMSTAMGNMPDSLVAPAFAASVVLAKTEDVSLEIPIEEDQWVAGLEFVEAHGADIVSSSLGYYDWYEYADLDGNTAVTTIAGDLAVARGLLVVTSAGNERGSTWGTLIAPADGDSILTIGAVDAVGDVTYFSSPGPTADGRIKPDVAALGYANRVADPYDEHAYLNASGTSFSCPLVSGVAALLLSRAPSLTPLQVREALTMTASQSATPDNDLGWGILDAFAAIAYFGPMWEHTALADIRDDVGPYSVRAVATDRVGMDPSSLRLWYRVDSGGWSSLALIPTGSPDEYGADIPGQASGSRIDYYLEGAGNNGVTTFSPPVLAVDEPHTFLILYPEGSPVPDTATAPWIARLDANAPNPFNPQTVVPFALEAAGSVHLGVFDLRGRLVRVLADGVLAAGEHKRLWDGRNTAGSVVSSGTYLVRLRTADMVLERKMLLLR